MKRRISALILVFLLLIQTFSPVWAATNEGYGEDQTSLGQAVDSFDTSDNISVAVEVIRNSTLEVMELNYTSLSIDYENFTAYTINDPVADLTVTELEIAFDTIRRDSDAYVSYDYGVNFFSDFVHWVDVNLTAVEAGDASNRGIVICWDVSNAGGNWDTVLGSDTILVTFQQVGATDNVYKFNIAWREGGVSQGASLGIQRNVNEEVYLVMNRTDDDFIFQVYEDSARTVLNETLTINNIANTQFRYVHGLCAYSHAGDPADHGTGTIQNLWLGNYSGGYSPAGYFETTDYLSIPEASGAGLAVLLNTTIPNNTTISFQISSDNTTWRDHLGVAGNGEDLSGGFEAIDLRDLNYSANIYFRGNLTTSNNTVTPRFNQIRLITMIGNQTILSQNVTGEWIEYNATAINATVGTVDAGQLNSTYFIDGNMFNVSELVGAPAMQISINFTGIDPYAESLWILFYGMYDGNLNHDFDIEVWNFTAAAWVEDDHIPDMVAFGWINTTIYQLRIPREFLSGGEVRVRLDHETAGNINHDLFIDYFRLQAFVPSDAEEIQFFWIVLGIALMLIGILLAMWWERRDP